MGNGGGFNSLLIKKKIMSIAPNFPKPKGVLLLVSQTGTNNPTAVIFHNSLGSITLTRSGVGIYEITCDKKFKEGKTFCNGITTDNPGESIVIAGSTVGSYKVKWQNISTLILEVYTTTSNSFLPRELSFLERPITLQISII